MKKSEFPDHVIFRQRLDKKYYCIVFRRNNLSFAQFQECDFGFLFEERFIYNGITCNFRIIIKVDNLYDIFMIDNKKIQIRGGKQHFGIYIRFSDAEQIPFDLKFKYNDISAQLTCEGNGSLYLDDIYTKKRQKLKKLYDSCEIHSSNHSYFNEIPSSVSWSVKHPFNGGGVSPK